MASESNSHSNSHIKDIHGEIVQKRELLEVEDIFTGYTEKTLPIVYGRPFENLVRYCETSLARFKSQGEEPVLRARAYFSEQLGKIQQSNLEYIEKWCQVVFLLKTCISYLEKNLPVVPVEAQSSDAHTSKVAGLPLSCEICHPPLISVFRELLSDLGAGVYLLRYYEGTREIHHEKLSYYFSKGHPPKRRVPPLQRINTPLSPEDIVYTYKKDAISPPCIAHFNFDYFVEGVKKSVRHLKADKSAVSIVIQLEADYYYFFRRESKKIGKTSQSNKEKLNQLVCLLKTCIFHLDQLERILPIYFYGAVKKRYEHSYFQSHIKYRSLIDILKHHLSDLAVAHYREPYCAVLRTGESSPKPQEIKEWQQRLKNGEQPIPPFSCSFWAKEKDNYLMELSGAGLGLILTAAIGIPLIFFSTVGTAGILPVGAAGVFFFLLFLNYALVNLFSYGDAYDEHQKQVSMSNF